MDGEKIDGKDYPNCRVGRKKIIHCVHWLKIPKERFKVQGSMFKVKFKVQG
jgi:hypothetical protein